MNISPVSEKCIADYPGYPGALNFSWSIDGTDLGGYASPRTPSGITLHGQEAIRDAVLQYAYDRETQTLTLECIVENIFLEKAAAALGTGSFPLLVHMSDKDIEMQTFGPVSFTPVDEQTRYFDFGHAVYTDAASGKSIEISGLELTPFGAVWKVRYEGAEAIHSPNGDPADAEVWSMLEDKVCIESQLFFSDGSAFSTGGALSAPYTSGAVELHCEWGSAINIDGIQKIVLGDLVLWKNFKPLQAKSRYPLFRDTGSLSASASVILCLCYGKGRILQHKILKAVLFLHQGKLTPHADIRPRLGKIVRIGKRVGRKKFQPLRAASGSVGNVAGIIAFPALLIHISGKLPFDADCPAKIVVRLLHHIIDHRIEHGAAHACQIQFAGFVLRKRLRCRLRRWERRRLSCRQRRFRREHRRRLLRCRRRRRAAGRKRAERYDDQQYAEPFFHFLTPPTTVPASQDRAKAMI